MFVHALRKVTVVVGFLVLCISHSQTWLPGRMGRFSSTFHGVCCCLDVVLCNSSQTLPASIASSCQVCCPVMIVVLVFLSHRHRPTTVTYYRHTYYSGTPPWTIEICPTILRLTQGRTFSPMVSHTCQPVKCPVPWGHLSLLSCTTLLGWGLNVWGYQ